MSEKEQLLKLINESKKSFWLNPRVLKSRLPTLYEEILSNWKFDRQPLRFSEVLYQYFYPTNIICKYGNKIGKNSQLFSFLLMINLLAPI